MVNILYLNPAGYIGGAEKSLIDLAVKLPREKFRPIVVSLSSGPLIEECKKHGIESREIILHPLLQRLSRRLGQKSLGWLLASPFLSLPAIIKLVKLVRTDRIEIIHTNGIKAHLLGIAVSRLSGRKLIWHFRDLLEKGFFALLFRRLVPFFPERIIANSNKTKECLGNREKIEVVYNGVDLDLFSRPGDHLHFRKRWGVAPRELLIGTVGHFAPLKGYEDFVKAMPIILNKFPRVKFLIAGGAVYPAYRSHRKYIMDLISSLGLSSQVILAGEIKESPPVFAAMDIFVFPSRSEGFGRGNLEAMAAGKPVVSTRVGGIPEVVIAGETGYLVPSHSPRELARAITELALNPDLRARMGRAGRGRAELFTIGKMVDEVVRVYEEVID